MVGHSGRTPERPQRVPGPCPSEVDPKGWTEFGAPLDGVADNQEGGPKAAIHSGLDSALGFAVGMPIAEHPPHRSVQAELPHTAPPLDSSVEADIGIRMKSSWTRDPSVEDGPQLFPIGLPPLTPAT